jgi:hypothetical protein
VESRQFSASLPDSRQCSTINSAAINDMFMHGEYESKGLIILEHSVGVGHFLELVKITVRLLERIAPEQVDILLEEVVVFVCLALTLCPFNLEAEDAGVLSQDVSLQ